MNNTDYMLRLAVSCWNTHIAPEKSNLTTPSFFNAMFGSKTRVARNEKRVIRLYQSDPYALKNRRSDLKFEQIYESEVIEDAEDVKPSLLAYMKCPENANFDRKIRFYVFYSSNLTNGKEILLAGTSFELRDLLSTTGVYSPKGGMFSEHCNNAKANVLVLNEISPIFTNEDISFRSTSNFKNPLSQEYVFYDVNKTSATHDYPVLQAQEMTIEPRLSTQVSLEFLKNMKKEITRSSQAWKERYLLERMRQGKFKTTAEAFANGWHEMEITVKGSILNFSEDQCSAMRNSESRLFDPRDQHCRNSIIDSPLELKLKEEDIEWSASSALSGRASRISTALTTSGEVFGDTISSYYNVSVQSEDRIFSRDVGNTNVEYVTRQPIYGSNLNAHVLSRADIEFETSNNAWLSCKNCEYTGSRSQIKGETTLKYPITVRAKTTSMHLYVPRDVTCNVGFKLFVDTKGKSKRHFQNIGFCAIPVVDYLNSESWTRRCDETNPSIQICTQEFWAPVIIQDASVGDGDAHVLVSISVKVPVNIECMYPAPYDLSEFYSQDMTNLESNKTSVEEYEQRTAVNIVSLPDGSRGIKIVDHIDSSMILAACYDWMHVCGCLYQDPLTIVPEGEENEVGLTSARIRRLDVPYSIEWFENHIYNIDAIMMNIENSILECTHRCKSNITFRTSADKTKENIQGCATNLHAQVFSCNAFRIDDTSSDVVEVETVFGMMTCGAPTTHALKTSRGGVSNIERGIDAKWKELLALKNKLYASCEFMGSVDILSSMNKLSLESDPESMNNMEILKKVQHIATGIENDYLDVCLRRIYSLSQVLSTVVNGFIMKLNLVVEGHIGHEVAEEWVHHGFLVIFEGLLSATGKERTMLEDAHAVIESLRLFKLRVVEAGGKLVKNDGRIETTKLQDVEDEKVSVSIARRVVYLFIPKGALSLLPPIYSSGCEISFCTILFTQGIDLRQSMATAYCGESALRDMNTAEIQKYLNNNSLDVLNEFCHKKQPIQRPTNVSPNHSKNMHPTLHALSRTIFNTSPLEKDITMLMEIEQVGNLLDGLRVSFCKSGKDRTGMAVTLEQSRFIGNRYNCGTSDELLFKHASTMRLHGTRLDLCEKNIGKAVYSINSLQAQFLPPLYRPPPSVLENILKAGDNS